MADLVDRFVSSEAATYTFPCASSRSTAQLADAGPAVACVRCPCRRRASTPGCWPRKTPPFCLAELRRRTDYREHSSPYLMVNNGQSTVVSAMRAGPTSATS